MKGNVVQHPSTPEEYTVDLTTINDPEAYVNETLELAIGFSRIAHLTASAVPSCCP